MRPVIIALDFPDQETTLKFLKRFSSPDKLYVKIGMELFYREGPQIVQKLRDLGVHIFLDLKLHDIPNTVEAAAYQVAKMGVEMMTIHASGGSEMIKAARRGLDQGSYDNGNEAPQLLAVTQLTSTSEEQVQEEQLVEATLSQSVIHLAKMALDYGADGVISSSLEDPMIHRNTSQDFKCINPGIRFADNDSDDQERITTPEQAARLGSNGIVVGRAVTEADDPVAAYQRVLNEWGTSDDD